MGKRMNLIMLFVNAFFVVINGALMYVSALPSINLICGLICLGGCISCWEMYKTNNGS